MLGITGLPSPFLLLSPEADFSLLAQDSDICFVLVPFGKAEWLLDTLLVPVFAAQPFKNAPLQ